MEGVWGVSYHSKVCRLSSFVCLECCRLLELPLALFGLLLVVFVAGRVVHQRELQQRPEHERQAHASPDVDGLRTHTHHRYGITNFITNLACNTEWI